MVPGKVHAVGAARDQNGLVVGNAMGNFPSVMLRDTERHLFTFIHFYYRQYVVNSCGITAIKMFAFSQESGC